MNETVQFALGCVFCVLVVIFLSWPTGIFNVKMFRGINDNRPGGFELLKAYVPIYNVRYARVLAYGSSPIYMAGLVFITVVALMRIIGSVLCALDIGFGAYIFIFSTFGTIAAVLLWYVLGVVNAVDFCRMLGCSGFTMLVCIFCMPLGYYMLANAVMPYFKREESDLNGTFGD